MRRPVSVSSTRVQREFSLQVETLSVVVGAPVLFYREFSRSKGVTLGLGSSMPCRQFAVSLSPSPNQLTHPNAHFKGDHRLKWVVPSRFCRRERGVCIHSQLLDSRSTQRGCSSDLCRQMDAREEVECQAADHDRYVGARRWKELSDRRFGGFRINRVEPPRLRVKSIEIYVGEFWITCPFKHVHSAYFSIGITRRDIYLCGVSIRCAVRLILKIIRKRRRIASRRLFYNITVRTEHRSLFLRGMFLYEA